MKWVSTALVVLLMALPPAICASEGATSSAVSVPWALVAHSDLIFVGKLVDYAPDAKRAEGYVNLDVTKVLKGSYYAKSLHTEYGISDDLVPFLKASRGQMVIAFLVGGMDPYLHRVSHQLYAGDGVNVLISDSPDTERLVQTELDREQYQISAIPALMNHQAGDARDRVDDAVDKLSSYFKFRRDQGIDELLKIGCKGVPYIVMSLNDRRPVHGMMHLFEIQGDMIWTPHDFDRWGPATIGDALPEVLFQITGISWQLRTQYKLDEIARKDDYDFWLIYLANHAYQRDPQDFGQWHDQCAGQIWSINRDRPRLFAAS